MKRKGKRGKRGTHSASRRSGNVPEAPFRRSFRPWAILLLLLALTCAAYWPVCTQDFTMWDDVENIVKNPDLNPPTFRGILRYWHPKNTARGLYAPVTYTVWGIVALVPGRGVGTPPDSALNPHAFHTVNLLLHVLSVWMVFLFLRSMLRPIAADHKASDWAACAGALLFALHPAQVESVAWVSGTKDLLCGLLTIVALGQYLGYVRAKHNEDNSLSWPRVWHPRYLAAVGAFLLAMFAKPAGVAMPLAAGSIAFFALKRRFWQVVLDQLPLLVLSAVFILFNKSAQQSGPINLTPLADRPFIAGDAISFYLYKLFVPVGFCIHYGRTPQYWSAQDWKYLTGVLPYVLAAAAALWFWIAKSKRESLRWVFAGAAVFVAGLLPVLGLMHFMFQWLSTVADHYLYLPMLGPALILAYLLARTRRLGWRIAAATGLCVLGVLAACQVPKWKDSDTLLRHAIAVNPDSWIAYNNLAMEYERKGELVQAIAQYRKALDKEPNNFGTLFRLGICLKNGNQPDQAEIEFAEALKLNPDDARTHFNMGLVLGMQNKFEQAAEHYREAIRLDPSYAHAHNNLGLIYERRGNPAAAAAHYEEAVKYAPDMRQARANLERARNRIGEQRR